MRWLDARRLLVVRADNIGDVLMTAPALRALRAALPDAAITLLASPAGTAMQISASPASSKPASPGARRLRTRRRAVGNP